jgi:hypothetical protein
VSLPNPSFGRTSQASSASFFSQALIPFGLAFRLYDAFSVAVQRKWTCWVARSLAGRGGLPLLAVVMGDILSHKNSSCNPLE